MQQIFTSYIYENPLPQLRARNAFFPNVCHLDGEHLIAAYQLGEAMESVDATTVLSESTDGGRTWSAPWRVFDPKDDRVPMSDCAKITRLPDGRLLLLGYTFYREDPELPLGNAQTGGLLRDEVFYTVSADGGKHWMPKQFIPNTWQGHTEASAPLSVLRDGSWATPITGFPAWNGEPVARNCGRLLRSYDNGRTWTDESVTMQFPGDTVTCYEQRMCQLEDGTLVVIGWNEDTVSGKLLNNHITLSTDNGKSFTAPIDTGIRGQASGIVCLGGSRVMTLHAMRRDTAAPGIYACIADLSGSVWKQEDFFCVWQPPIPFTRSDKMADIFAFLKFGQPSAICMPDGSILVTFWLCEDCCYKILAQRIRI